MNIANVIDNMTDDYNDSLSINNNCTNNENNIHTIIPSLLLTIPYGFSFLCMLTVIVYTIIKPLFIKNRFLQL